MEVVAQYSYGRLGRISEALALLIDESHANGAPKEKQFSDFLKMKCEIDELKQKGLDTRVDEIINDLARLKKDHKEEYTRLRKKLKALD